MSIWKLSWIAESMIINLMGVSNKKLKVAIMILDIINAEMLLKCMRHVTKV